MRLTCRRRGGCLLPYCSSAVRITASTTAQVFLGLGSGGWMFVGFRAGSLLLGRIAIMAEQSRFVGVSDSDAEAGQEVCDEIVCRITCIKTSIRGYLSKIGRHGRHYVAI